MERIKQLKLPRTASFEGDNPEKLDAGLKRYDPYVLGLGARTVGHPREISPKTIQTYQGYVKSLRGSFIDQLGFEPNRDIRPTELVDHLLSRVHSIRPKTFISYRCGLLYWFETCGPSADVQQARLTLQTQPKSGYLGPRPGTTSTLYSRSSSHPRTFSRRNFDKLIAELNRRISVADRQKRGRPRAAQLLYWLQAGLASGLRPIEWESARWKDEESGQLLVRTAKVKVGQSALPKLKDRPPKTVAYRVVDIDEADRYFVNAHLRQIETALQTAPFATYYNSTRQYLWARCKELFPGADQAQFTLYMMRGQFSANRKRRASVAAVAAEMGCSPAIASKHYGSRRYAHRARGPSAKVTQTTAERPSDTPPGAVFKPRN